MPDTKRPPCLRPLIVPYAESSPTPVEVLPPIKPSPLPGEPLYAESAEDALMRSAATLGFTLSAALAWWIASDIVRALFSKDAH